MRHLPEWLEEFAENLEDTEVPAPAHMSHDSGSERLTKEAPRKHSNFTHFPKDRNSEACLRTKMTIAPCRRRTGEAAPRAEKCGDLITVDHKKSSTRYVNQETITGTQSWYKILPDNRFNLIRAKQRSTLTIRWKLANPVKNYHGIIAHQRFTDPGRNRVWMKNGGRIPWSAIAIFDMFKTSWQMGKLLMKGDSEYHSKAQ